MVGGADVEVGQVLVEGGLVEPRDLQRRLALGPGLRQHLVLALGVDLRVVGEVADVGDVLRKGDPQAVQLGDPADQVRQQPRPQVADVAVAVDRRPAGVDAQLTRVGRDDLLDLPGTGVREAQHDPTL